MAEGLAAGLGVVDWCGDVVFRGRLDGLAYVTGWVWLESRWIPAGGRGEKHGSDKVSLYNPRQRVPRWANCQ